MIGEKSPVLSVSIHQNSYQQDAFVHGPQVFYYESSEEGKKMVRRQYKQPEWKAGNRPTKRNQGKYQLLSAQKKSRNACDRRMWFPDQSRRGQEIADRIVSAKSSGRSGRWNWYKHICMWITGKVTAKKCKYCENQEVCLLYESSFVILNPYEQRKNDFTGSGRYKV